MCRSRFSKITILLISFTLFPNLSEGHQNAALWRKETIMKFGYAGDEIIFTIRQSMGPRELFLANKHGSLGNIKKAHLDEVNEIEMRTVNVTPIGNDTIKLSFYFNKLLEGIDKKKHIQFYFRNGQYLGKKVVIPKKNAAPTYVYTDIKLVKGGKILKLDPKDPEGIK